MRFTNCANRKWIAWFLFLVFYSDLCAAVSGPIVLTKHWNVVRPNNFAAGSAVNPPVTPAYNEPVIPVDTVKFRKQLAVESNQQFIDGPGQPEMSSFKPTGLDNMVDLFTGDFSYSIPLMDVGGYPINLFYSGGISMEQEASWVGLGWNINPGTISRNMRGLPDDFNGDVVTKDFNIKKDITVGVKMGKTYEFFGKSKDKKFPLPISLKTSVGIFYNNYRGVGVEAGVNPIMQISKTNSTEETKGVIDKTEIESGVNFNFNSQSGIGVSPYVNVKLTEKNTTTGAGASLNYNSRVGLQSLQLHTEVRNYSDPTNRFISEFEPGLSTTISFAKPSVTPSIRIPMQTFNANVMLRFGKGYKKGLLKNQPELSGYLTESKPQYSQKSSKAYGFLHFDNAGDKDALMDFNRINDIPYTESNPVMAFPVYTYDVFTINGEGTGGSFRGYRSDIGFIRDQFTKSKSSSFSLGVGFNKGTDPESFKVDVDLEPVFSVTQVGTWQAGNIAKDVLKFTSDKGRYQSVYFKNPSEKTIIDQDYYNSIGGDDMVRLKMTKTSVQAQLKPILDVYNPLTKEYIRSSAINSSNSIRTQRDKRSQVISVLTAAEASVAGLTRDIEYYPVNEFPKGDCDPNKKTIKRVDKNRVPAAQFRKPHHISEVRVMGGDGRTYVYGIPTYNYKQVDATFNVENNTSHPTEGTVEYDPSSPNPDNTTENRKGLDHYYQKETIPAYAHSFLLSGLLSPDYVDVKGDGITEDDLGNAVKFNYSKVFFGDRDYIKWRAPFTREVNRANYSPGLITDRMDNKANYSYGEKELWYLNSVESKTMIAIFKVSPNRNDGKEALGENGGINTEIGTYRLDTIHLYSKAAYNKYGTAAKPIKSVVFEYAAAADELCKGVENALLNNGKLTLKAVSFGYAGIFKKKSGKSVNRYFFKYKNNKDYNRTSNDRWGNYKNDAHNPSGLTNAMHPYTNQSSFTDELTPWQMEEVILPSGGKIKVTYEHDDYAYVQNRRAAVMTNIAGFGSAPDGVFSNALYTKQNLDFQDHFYVYFNAAEVLPANELQAKNLIQAQYLADLKQLYLNLMVGVPQDQFGSGYEQIGLYADISDWGPAPNRNYFYVKVGGINSRISQIMEAIIQFGKDNLSSKLYPGSNTKDQGAVKALVTSLLAMGPEIIRTVGGFEGAVRLQRIFKYTDIAKCYARLSRYNLKKIGGGYRVKEVRISDQWDVMTGQFKSEYGQTYDYTTKAIINGQEMTISSGVASYEPSIGNEENPFREIMRTRINHPLGRDQYLMQEMPVGEMFYPSAMVGYSKVRVSSIKKGNVKNGTSVQEVTYFTTKDFPTVSNYTSFDPTSKIKYRPDPFSKILTHRSLRMDNLSQGLLVSLNDMNGKMKSQATYAEGDLIHPVSYTENIYRMDKISENNVKLNNTVKAIKDPGAKIYNDELIGKDVELMVDLREHYSRTNTISLKDLNVEVLKLTPLPIIIPVLLRGVFKEENIYRAASVVKIVNSYGILDSVISIDKGSMVGTRNLVYDGTTGEVLLNRTNNEFDKPVYNFTYPAYWAYKGMGPAYQNINAVYSDIHFRDGRIVKGDILNELESGDEIMIVSRPFFQVPAQSFGCQVINGVIPGVASKDNIIWAVGIQKDAYNVDKDFIFVNRYGDLFTGIADIKIIRSGFRNLLGASVGTVVSQKSPIQKEGADDYIKFNDATAVLNAGVQEFKEMWRTDSLLELKETYTKVTNPGTFSNYTLAPQQAISIWGYYDLNILNGTHDFASGDFTSTSTGFKASFFAQKSGSKNKAGAVKSWLRFNLSSIPANSFVTRSFLQAGAVAINNNFYPHLSAFPVTNNLFIQRTKHSWFSNFNDWKTVFFNNRPRANTIIYPSTLLTNNGNIYGPGSNDAYITTTPLVKEMLYDRDLGNNYTTAFKLSLKDDQLYPGSYPNAIYDNDGTQVNTNIGKNLPNNYASFKSDGNDCNSSYTRTNSIMQSSICTKLNVTCLTCPSGYTVDSVFYFKSGMQYFCSSYEWVKSCESIFNRTFINPYTTGLLGNWRPYRSLVYYGSRQQTSTETPVQLSTGGVIADYTSYWLFNSTGLTTAAPAVWTWNSEITQFNIKGAELENKDPLGRYNAGLYGYNDLMPIAVANNSRYHEIAYDGFEDYDFHTQDCEPFCKKSRRIQFTNSNGLSVSTDKSHTGISSLKINPGNIVNLAGSVKPASNDDYAVEIRMNSSSQNVTTVNGLGTGFTGNYYSNTNFTGSPTQRIDQKIAFDWGINSAAPFNAKGVVWDGSLQAPQAGNYKLKISFNGYAKVWVGGTVVLESNPGVGVQVSEISLGSLSQGALKAIKIQYKLYSFGFFNSIVASTIKVEWKRLEDAGNYILTTPSLTYAPGTEGTAPNAISSQTVWCIQPNRIKATGNFLIDGFNLEQSRKMIVSAWVNEGGQDCKCSTYSNSYVKVYMNGVAITAELKPTGNIIDGWQRMEGEFVVGSGSTYFSIQIVNTSGTNPVYYDDVRVQPFNSNMKSFVYHPYTLRLMAELDENNYASFYEYDDEGTLVRVKKETEKGIKTITETRNAVQKNINE